MAMGPLATCIHICGYGCNYGYGHGHAYLVDLAQHYCQAHVSCALGAAVSARPQGIYLLQTRYFLHTVAGVEAINCNAGHLRSWYLVPVQ